MKVFSPFGNMSPGFLNFGVRTVVIVVGEEKIPFCVHKDLIMQHSQYFRAALSNIFRESVSSTVHLSKVRPEIFRIFLQWLYAQCTRDTSPVVAAHRGDLDMCVQTLRKKIQKVRGLLFQKMLETWKKSCESTQLRETGLTIQELLLDMYIFADVHDIRQLRNDIISAIYYQNAIHDIPLHLGHDVSKAYNNLSEASTWCRYVLNVAAVSLDYRGADDEFLNFPPIFLVQVMKINTRRANGIMTPKHDTEQQRHPKGDVESSLTVPHEYICHFHEHQTPAEEQKCKEEGLRSNVYVHNLLSTCITSVHQAAETVPPESAPNKDSMPTG